MAINVNSLNAYVDEKRLPLISKTLLGAKTAGLLTLVADVKQKTALNLLNTDIVFGDGSTCGWNDAGTSTLSQRFIDPKFLKINQSFCYKALLNKWTSYDVSLAAGKEKLPFEESFINSVVDGVNVAIEKMIWQGKKTESNQDGEYLLPGTSVRVIATSGLNGSKVAGEDRIVAGRLSNMFYGVSAEEDADTFDFWFSKDQDEFRLKIQFGAGVQIAYPDEMVISKDA